MNSYIITFRRTNGEEGEVVQLANDQVKTYSIRESAERARDYFQRQEPTTAFVIAEVGK